MKTITNREQITAKMIVAYHEAGHAVVTYLVGRSFIYVIIESLKPTDTVEINEVNGAINLLWSEGYRGRVHYPEVTEEMVKYYKYIGKERSNINDSYLDKLYILDKKKNILCTLAGDIAQKMLTGYTVQISQSDIEDVYRYASGMSLESNDEIHATIKSLEKECKNMLKANWKAVENLAQELLKKNKIGYEDACGIIKQALGHS